MALALDDHPSRSTTCHGTVFTVRTGQMYPSSSYVLVTVIVWMLSPSRTILRPPFLTLSRHISCTIRRGWLQNIPQFESVKYKLPTVSALSSHDERMATFGSGRYSQHNFAHDAVACNSRLSNGPNTLEAQRKLFPSFTSKRHIP